MNHFATVSYLIPPLIASGIAILLLIIVLRHDYRSFTNRVFSLLLLTIGLWGILIFGMRSSPDATYALYWDKAVTPIPVAMGLLYYHFSLLITRTKKQRNLLRLIYIMLFLVIALSPTGLFITRMEVQDYGYAPIFTAGIIPVFALGFFPICMGFYNLAKGYRSSARYEERNRFLIIMLAMVFPIMGGFLEAFPTIYPSSMFANIGFCLITTVAIVKYHLLDIQVVIRKSLAYLLVSLMIAMPYVSILLLLNQILRTRMEPWWVHSIIVLLLAILLRPLYSRAQHLVDRLFYRDRYDYLKALEQFSQKAQSVVNLKELSSTLTQLVSGALRTSSACLLLPSESGNGLIVVSSTGLGSPPFGVVLRNRSPLIKWLKLKQRILSPEEFNIVPQLQSLSLREKNNLEQMEAKLYVPIQTGPGQLSGILVLGQKLSQQPYSSEDKQLLTALGSQMAIALENARLYNESQQEVEERKQAEEALLKYKMAVDSSADLITAVDQHYVYIFVNQTFLKYNCLKQDQVIGHTAAEILGEEVFRKTVKPNVDRCLQGQIVDYEMERHYPEVGRRHLDVSYHPLKSSNKQTIGVVAVIRDITERKQAEEREKELQQELYLSSRLASIGELAAGVAHQINNPLTGVLGFSQRLLKKSTDQEVSQDLKRICTEAERAAKVVQNLLTFARRRQPKKQYSDINEILQSALELRAYELKTSNIEVVTDLAPNLPQLMLDFHQIQEVFLNIILNAEQVMTEAHSGGRLTIKTEERKGYIRTTFNDDGPGIAREDLDKLFDPFFSTRGEKGGTGLGLSVCHGIITEHGGRIYAKSKPGKGATFFVELPIISETANKRLIENK